MPVRILLLLVAVVAFAIALYVAFDGTTAGTATELSQAEMSAADDVAGASLNVAQEPLVNDATTGYTEETPTRDIRDRSTPSGDPVGSIPGSSVYDVVFGTDTYSPLSKVHMHFKREPRDESWASAMEIGIGHSIERSEQTSWATVEQIECRSTICEVAGFMPDNMQNPEFDPYKLFSDDFGVGWWQGPLDMSLRQHTYEEEGITRFLFIIANRGVIQQFMPPEEPVE